MKMKTPRRWSAEGRALIILLLLLAKSKANICNNYATLIEKDRFYEAQPFQTEMEMDLENYNHFFDEMENSKDPFKQQLQQHSSAEKLQAMEPLALEPFDENRNIIQLPEGELKDAPEACAKQGGEMIYIRGNHSRSRVREVIRKLGLDAAPVAVIPLEKAIYSPYMDFLEASSKDKVAKIPAEGWPLFTKLGKYQYPAETEGSSTAKPPAIKILCFKANNPWDLPNKQKSWLAKIPKLQQALGILDTLASSYGTARKFFSKLDKARETATKKITPMLPQLFQGVIHFLKEFSNGERWARSTSGDEKGFDNFIRDAAQIEASLHKTQTPLVAVRRKNQPFELPLDPEPYWLDQLQLDEKTYGLSKPLKVYALGDDSNDGDSTIVTQVNVQTFHKEDDLMTLYAVEPNIVNGEITTIRYVLASASVFVAATEMPSPIDCHYKEGTPYKVCRAVAIPSIPPVPEQDMVSCAKALLNTGLGLGFSKCPSSPAPNFPIAYRARCEGNETAIISAVKPVRVSTICNGKETSSELLSRFPARLTTGCEIQEIEGEVRRTLLPQATKETLQAGSNHQWTLPPPGDEKELPGWLFVLAMAGYCMFAVLSVLLCACLMQKYDKPIRNYCCPPLLPYPDDEEDLRQTTAAGSEPGQRPRSRAPSLQSVRSTDSRRLTKDIHQF